MADWKNNPAVLTLGIVIIVVVLVLSVIRMLPKSQTQEAGMVKCPDCAAVYSLADPETKKYEVNCPECEGKLSISETAGVCSECGDMVSAAAADAENSAGGQEQAQAQEDSGQDTEQQ